MVVEDRVINQLRFNPIELHVNDHANPRFQFAEHDAKESPPYITLKMCALASYSLS